MDTLSYELLSDVSKYSSNKSLLAFYECTKLLFYLRRMNQIQICSVKNYYNENYDLHISKVIPKIPHNDPKYYDDNYFHPQLKLPHTVGIAIVSQQFIKCTHITKLKYITFRYPSKLDKFKMIPSSVTHLNMGYFFNSNIIDIFPKSLIYLKFGYNFNKNIDCLKTQTPILQFLQFGHDFGYPVDNLPTSLKYLVFGRRFNQTIDNLPQTLTHIKIGERFNQSIDKLPKSVICISLLEMQISVFHSINTYLKNKVQHPNIHFIFDNHFNTSINDLSLLSLSITRLKFGHYFNSPINILPSSLIQIEFGNNFDQTINNLPINLEIIIFSNNFNQSIDNLPSSVHRIIFKYGKFNQIISKLPESLKYLRLSDNFNHSIDGLITPSLLFIKFGKYFNQPVNNLSSSLKRIIFGDDFNHPIDNLPKSVSCFTFGKYFNQSFENIFFTSLTCYGALNGFTSPTIKKLELMADYDFDFKIPKSVRYLTIHKKYVDRIPKTVKYIELL
jgi:hypothetical protein